MYIYPIAIEPGDEEHAFGVTVPDIPGCFSAGDSLDEALAQAKEAITGHLEILAEGGELPPKPSKAGDLAKLPEYAGYMWGVVEIDEEPYLGKSEKINVTLPRLLTSKIDNLTGKSKHFKNRSHFLQQAALRLLEQERQNQHA